MAIFWTFLGPAICMWFFGFLTPAASGLAAITLIDTGAHSQLASLVANALRHDGHLVTEAVSPPDSGLFVEVQPAVPQVILHTDGSDAKTEASVKYEIEAALLPRQTSAITVDISTSHELPATGGFQRTVPAYLIMFLTMNLLVSGASFTEERASGRIRRLLSSPVPALSIITGRLASRLVIAWLQMVVLFSIGVFALRIHWAQHSTALILILSLYVLAMGGIGILIGTCFQDPSQASAFAMWTALILAPLTGLWWPIELMPNAMQTLARVLPTGWVMQAVNLLLASGAGMSDFRLTIAGLLVVGAVTIWASALRLGTLAR